MIQSLVDICRTQTRLDQVTSLTINITTVLMHPILEPGVFAQLTARFVDVARVFLSLIPSPSCNYHADQGKCGQLFPGSALLWYT
jgi:hypothetical protein